MRRSLEAVLLHVSCILVIVGVGVSGVAEAGTRTFATASFVPAANPPIVSGDSFTYSYSDYSGTPNPSATPSGTVTVTAYSGATFKGMKNLTELDLVDSNALYLDINSQYIGFAAGKAGSAEELYFGDATDYMDAYGDDTYTFDQYPSGLVQDRYPEAAGLRWSPFATDNYDSTSTSSDGTSYSDDAEARYADGSYSIAITFDQELDMVGSVYQVFSDDSAFSDVASLSTTDVITNIGAPVYGKNAYVIPVSVSGGDPDVGRSTSAAAGTVDVPDWYPGHAFVSPLAIGFVENAGLTVTPGVCGIRRGLAAFKMHATQQKTDPLEGTVTTTVGDTFDAAGLGTVCSISTTRIAFYDAAKTGRYVGQNVQSRVSILTSESGPKPLSAFIDARGLVRAFMPHIPVALFARGGHPVSPRLRRPRLASGGYRTLQQFYFP